MFLRSAVIVVAGLAEEIDHVSLLQMKVHEHIAGNRTVEEVETGGSPTCLYPSGDCKCSVPPAQICSDSKLIAVNIHELTGNRDSEVWNAMNPAKNPTVEVIRR